MLLGPSVICGEICGEAAVFLGDFVPIQKLDLGEFLDGEVAEFTQRSLYRVASKANVLEFGQFFEMRKHNVVKFVFRQIYATVAQVQHS